VNHSRPDAGLPALGADILLAQELRDTPGGYETVRPSLEGLPWGSAVLSRLPRLEMAPAVRLPDVAGSRARVAAASADLADGSSLTLVSCHVWFDENDRAYSVTSFLRLVADLIPAIDATVKRTVPHCHILIGGDFNIDAARWGPRHGTALRLLEEWGLVDLAAGQGVLDTTWPVVGRANVRRVRLDYLFASKALLGGGYSVRICGAQEQGWPSDHAAVVAEFPALTWAA